MTTRVKTRKLRNVILNHELYFNPSEVSMAKSILDWLPYEDKTADTLSYFKKLRRRQLKSHKVHARFALTIFEMAGMTYSQL